MELDPLDELRRLPVGSAEFEAFVDRIQSYISDILPTIDRDSIVHVLAVNIMHLKQDVAEMTDREFVNLLIKASANQVASAKFQEVKLRQIERAKQQEAEANVPQAAPEEAKD